MVDILLLIPEITKGMKSLGSKSLLKIKNSTTVLEYQISQLRKHNPKSTIFIGTGFESDKIKKHFGHYNKIEFIDNPVYIKTNQSKLIESFVASYTSENLLVISNGILFKNDPFSVRDAESSKIFLIDKPKNHFNIGCNSTEKIHYLFYDLPSVWSECVLFDKPALRSIRQLSLKTYIDQMYLFELINLLLDNPDLHFEKQIISKKDIMKINSIKDITSAKLFI